MLGEDIPSHPALFWTSLLFFYILRYMINNRYTKVIVAIVTVCIFVGVIFLVKKDIKKMTTHITAADSTLNRFCNCTILTNSLLIDSSTGAFRQRVPNTNKKFLGAIQYLSPSKTQEAMLTSDNRELYLMKYPEQTLTFLYDAPESQQIKNVLWSTDEQRITFELSNPMSTIADGTQGVVTSILSVTISLKKTQLVLDVAATTPESKKGFSLVWISDDLQHLVYFVGNMTDGVTWYRSDAGKVSVIPEKIFGAIYMKIAVTTSSSGEKISQLLWLNGQGLHGYQLDTGTIIDYTISTWSDGPMSPPSPDGTSVVYVRRISNEQAGQLVRLNLQSKSEELLTNDVWTNPIDLGQAVWSPDGTRLLFFNSYPTLHTIMVKMQPFSPIITLSHIEINQLNNQIKASVPK